MRGKEGSGEPAHFSIKLLKAMFTFRHRGSEESTICTNSHSITVTVLQQKLLSAMLEENTFLRARTAFSLGKSIPKAEKEEKGTDDKWAWVQCCFQLRHTIKHL